MSLFTGKLGSSASQLGNIVLGFGGSEINKTSADTISFTETATSQHLLSGVVTETISLTESPLTNSVFTKSTSDTLNFTDGAVGGLTLNGTLGDTLSIAEAAYGVGTNRGTDAFLWIEDASGYNPLVDKATDTWSPTEIINKTLIPSRITADKITFVEAADAQTKLTRQNTEFLNFVESADRGPGTQNVTSSDSVTLTESTEGFFVRTGIDTITFTDDSEGEIVHGVSESLIITESAEGVGRQVITDKLIINEVIVGDRVRSLMANDFFGIVDHTESSYLHTSKSSDTITFTESVVKQRFTSSGSDSLTLTDAPNAVPSYKRVVSESLTLTEAATNNRIYVRTASDTITFNETKFDPTENVYVGGVLGMVVIPNAITLQTSSGTITLPRPEFGDSENTTNEFSLRYARTGTVYTTIRRRRLNRRLVMSFNIPSRKKRELVQFLTASNDKFMHLVNWKGEKWKLKLLTNPIQSNNIGFDRFRVELEFEGIQLTSGGVNTCQC